MAGSTRRLSPLEKENGLVEIPLCKDPLAVIVNKSCTVKNLSLRQLKDIFTKRVTNWKDVGGFDQPITIIIPEKNSGAFKNFSQLFMGTEEIKEDFIAGEAYKVVTGVSSIEGSISFIANSIAKNTSEKDSSVSKIFSLNINGKPPAHLAYPFQQTFSIVIRNENSQVIRDVLKFMLSDRVKKKIILHGMTPIPFKIPKVG
jgi:phosphate transport system substrate-binding protein